MIFLNIIIVRLLILLLQTEFAVNTDYLPQAAFYGIGERPVLSWLGSGFKIWCHLNTNMNITCSDQHVRNLTNHKMWVIVLLSKQTCTSSPNTGRENYSKVSQWKF